MKKLFAILLCFVLMAAALPTLAETTQPFDFTDLSKLQFIFSSGVGGWSTLLDIDETGSFTGFFHDSDLGDTLEGYPNGTEYRCCFHGQLTFERMENDYTAVLRIAALAPDEDVIGQPQFDGVYYVPSEPYGLMNADELLLYLPGAPIAELPEDFLMWANMALYGYTGATLPFYGLYNAPEETAFIGDEKLTDDDIAFEQFSTGWIVPETPAVEGVAADVFTAALDGWTGTGLTPIALLDTREDDGVDYRYLCRMTTMTAEPTTTLAIVTIHQAYNGDTTITNIDDIPEA